MGFGFAVAKSKKMKGVRGVKECALAVSYLGIVFALVFHQGDEG